VFPFGTGVVSQAKPKASRSQAKDSQQGQLEVQGRQPSPARLRPLPWLQQVRRTRSLRREGCAVKLRTNQTPQPHPPREAASGKAVFQ